ncbi:hypothetical protein ACIPWI_19350 [Streptomyces sp. NPDC090046]|uniref:hypothetical protein n=1 Tax=Streptomyces sp. NPDC090046 TaxID=3365928 RepID=UPI00382531D9
MAPALTGHDDLADADADVVAACAEADPKPFLDTAAERRLGTGALLRALRAAHGGHRTPWAVRRSMEAVLREPYRIGRAPIAAAGLGRRLPRTAADILARRPDCPPEAAVVLRTGQPARPRSRICRRARPGGPNGSRPAMPARSGRAPLRRAMPCGPRSPTTPARTREDPHTVTLDHLGAVIERGQPSAFEVAPLVRPASLLTSWVGQASGWGSVSNAAWSGRAALRVETAALPARWAAGGVSAGRWAAFHPLLTSDPGPMPEFLDEVSAAHPDGITA